MRQEDCGHFLDRSTGKSHRVFLHHVQSEEEFGGYETEAVDCYKAVFSGHPYYEDYTGQEESFVIPLFRQFAREGVLVLAIAHINDQVRKVIGFGGGISADKSEVAEFLAQHSDKLEAPLSNYLYMAELGVLADFQRQGLGKRLILARISEATSNPRFSFSHLIMRTASAGSNSAGLYLGIGAHQVEGLIQRKDHFGTQSPERIFLVMRLR